jgi:hypothetical protein
MSVHYYEVPLSMHTYRSIVSIRMIETYMYKLQQVMHSGLCRSVTCFHCFFAIVPLLASALHATDIAVEDKDMQSQ